VLIVLTGCASRRPVPALVNNPIRTAPADTRSDQSRLKLLTYNVWGLPSWMTGARAGRYPEIARELERLDPDIIFLQEAWTAKARGAVPARGRWSIARAAGQHTFFQQTGLVTLSRFPIVGGEFYPFSRSAFPDKFVNKGVLKVTVKLPCGSLVNLWNVHLQDGGPPEIRRAQIRELELHVQAAEDGQIADLVGGDFNCHPESVFCRELTDTLGPSVQELDGAQPFATWDGLSEKPGAGEILDYIFVHGRAPVQSIEASTRVAFAAASRQERLSDHFGLEAVVTLTTETNLAGALGASAMGPRWSTLNPSRAVYAVRGAE
jgi:endonuclease/exonuclease/phosphatase family metal-dependent hydrolase